LPVRYKLVFPLINHQIFRLRNVKTKKAHPLSVGTLIDVFILKR